MSWLDLLAVHGTPQRLAASGPSVRIEASPDGSDESVTLVIEHPGELLRQVREGQLRHVAIAGPPPLTPPEPRDCGYCYPSGFNPATYEGPQRDCPLHGERQESIGRQIAEAARRMARRELIAMHREPMRLAAQRAVEGAQARLGGHLTSYEAATAATEGIMRYLSELED